MNISRLNFLKGSIGIASTALIPVSITKKNRIFSQSNSDLVPGKRDITIPTIDISSETDRHSIIAQGTSDIRQGHPATGWRNNLCNLESGAWRPFRTAQKKC